MKLPPGYLPVEAPGARAFALSSARPWTEATLARGETLHERALRSEDVEIFRGRGRVAVVGGAEGRWAVRHYRRGGAIARLLGDRYLRIGFPRPLVELWASVRVRELGIDTPQIVAGALYPGGPFYRADLVTAFVEKSRDLASALFGERAGPPDFERTEALAATGRLVAKMAARGVLHADLNASNVLLVAEKGGVRPLLLDLDRCRIRTGGRERLRGRLLGRLERSLQKIGAASQTPLRSEEWATLRRLARGPGQGQGT